MLVNYKDYEKEYPSLFIGLNARMKGQLAVYLSLGPSRTYKKAAELLNIAQGTFAQNSLKYGFKEKAEKFDLEIIGETMPKLKSMSLAYYENFLRIITRILQETLDNEDKIVKNIKIGELDDLIKLVKVNEIASKFIEMDEVSSATQADKTFEGLTEAMNELNKFSKTLNKDGDNNGN